MFWIAWRIGTEVSFDDGKLAGAVEDIREGNVLVRVTRTQRKGFKMKPERGLTFPRADLHLDPLTANDLTDLDFVAAHADLIGFSFVQSADDITRLQDELARRRPDWRRLGIIAKIETALAVKNLPDIIVRAAGRQPFGVMIARGDLAVAIGFERLAEMQEEILWLCEAAHVPVIWATQVLEEMVKSGPADARRDDRRGNGGPRRVRDAQQGPQCRRGDHRAAWPDAADDRAPVEEDRALAGVALVVAWDQLSMAPVFLPKVAE